MQGRNRAAALILLLCSLSVAVAATVMIFWYMNTKTMYMERVTEVVQIKKRHMESTYLSLSQDKNVKNPLQSTLGIIEKSLGHIPNGDFTCDIIVKSKNEKLEIFTSDSCLDSYVNIDKNIAKFINRPLPLPLALAGKSGSMIAVDGRGRKVIAAYDFIDIEGSRLAIVAKIDYSAMLVPKIKASLSAAFIALVIIAAGGFGFYRFSDISLKRLREANEDLSLMGEIIESVDEHIAYLDRDLRYVTGNKRQMDFFGIDEDELKRHSLGEFLGGEQGKALRQKGLSCLKGNNENFKAWMQSNGMPASFSDITLTPHYVDGEVVGIVLTATDRTDEENARLDLLATANELKKLSEELEERVQTETAKRMSHDRIFFEQKKFADMGQMMNAIAHQWRQPINSVGLYVQLIYDSVKDGTVDDELMENFKNDTIQLVQHMSKTIDDFRSFFDPRTQETDFEVVKAVVETTSLVEAQLKNSFITYNISCKCPIREFQTCNSLVHPPCGAPQTMVRGYSSEFKQVLMNLIQNAKDSIITKKGKKQIDIAIESDDEKVTLTISDNGDGIPNDVFDKIFDPYFTTKPEGKGTGIGLYMSRLIIEEHMNGKIMASNGTEGGAIFKITLKKVKV